MALTTDPRDVMSTDVPSDADLCQAVRGGDSGAFEQLYRRHAAWTRSRASRYVGAMEAEDITSDVFAGLLAALRRGHGPVGPVRPYLLTAVRHQAGRTLALAGRTLEGAEASDDELRDAVWVPSAEESAIAHQDGITASRAFATLREPLREAIELADIQGLSYRECAERLGMQESTFGRRLHVARRALFDAWLAEHIPPVDDTVAHPAELELARYLTGTLRTRATARIAAHLDECPGCSLRIAALDTETRRRSRRAAAFGPLALLPLWWQLHGQRSNPFKHLHLIAAGRAGTTLLVLTTVGASLVVPAALAPELGGSHGASPVISSGGPTAAQSAPTDTGVEVGWLPGASLAGAAAGDVVELPFRITAEGTATGSATLTITAGPGLTVEDQYQACHRAGSTVTCPRIGPLRDGDVLSGTLVVRVDDPTVATLPTLSVTR